MKLLFDTHAYFWWQTNDRRLSARARDAILDSTDEVFVSAATAWELATKTRTGKWPEAEVLAKDIELALEEEGFDALAVGLDHARLAGFLPGPHGDLFDRMLAAQSQIENAALVTADPVFRIFGTRTLW
jgi:PIN domain nuclease of toxin-antitoxin system